MTIIALDADTLQIRYDAASSPPIPATAQVTGFGFDFDFDPTAIGNPADGDFVGDRDDLDWIVYAKDTSTFPGIANGDEFVPPITQSFYTIGVTEGNDNNFSVPGILPDEYDVFSVDFTGIASDLTAIALEDFVNVTGIRLQGWEGEPNEGSLFLAGGSGGGGGGDPIPEPATMLLLGSGLIGLAATRRKKHTS
jgi:hypothetical protein